MRPYETAFLIAPNLSDEETEQLISQMAEIVSQKKGKMIHIDKWGKRKLAYSILKFEEASYVFFLYEGESGVSSELERRFKQNERVIRYLTVRKEEDRKQRGKKRKAKPARPRAGRELKPEGGVPEEDKTQEAKKQEEPDIKKAKEAEEKATLKGKKEEKKASPKPEDKKAAPRKTKDKKVEEKLSIEKKKTANVDVKKEPETKESPLDSNQKEEKK